MHARRHALIAAFAVLASLSLAPSAAKAQGLLVPTEPGLPPMALGHQRVRVEIRDGTAVTHVDETFVNPTNRTLEATYVFPLPKKAALGDFTMWIDGRKTKGQVLEKQKAAGIYEGIVRRLRDPGLLEYVGSGLFRARVYPVRPHASQRIQLSFSQVLDFAGGVYAYRYPLGATRATGSVRAATTGDLTFTAYVTSRVPIKTVYSPSHHVDVSRPDDHSATVGLETVGAALDHDLVLYYGVGDGDVGMSVLTYDDGSEPGYFLLMAAPKQSWQKDEIVGKVVTFVVDTSGSMAGEKLRNVKKALRYCLARLRTGDRFDIVRFSTGTERFRQTPVPATAANVRAAERFVSDFHAAGGTAIDDALVEGLRDGANVKKGTPHIVVFLTDGEPTVGNTSEARIAQDAKRAGAGHSRVFVFGVGKDLNATLLDRLAKEGRGAVSYAKTGKQTETLMSTFYDEIAYPVLTDVAMNLGEIGAYDVYPRQAPTLFKGSQLIVVGRYKKPGKHQVTLEGRAGGKTRRFHQTLAFTEKDTEHAFIQKLWAVRKVGYLLESIRLNGENPELRSSVIELGKRFGIVTPYTSYLVTDDSELRGRGGNTVDLLRRRETRRLYDRRYAPPPSPPATASAKPMHHSAGLPAPRAEAESTPVLAGEGAMTARTGAGAVAASSAVKALKEKKQVDMDGPGGTRLAGGHTFVPRSGFLTDTRWKPGLKILKVQYLSKAYFQLLKARPALKAQMALGERVRIVIDHGRGIEIGPTGESDPDAVTRFFK